MMIATQGMRFAKQPLDGEHLFDNLIYLMAAIESMSALPLP